MFDLVTVLLDLRRPNLLVRAAQFGLRDYRRDRDLKRIVRTDALPNPERAMHILMDEESRLDRIRRDGDATYSFARHIEVLVALLGEVRLLPRALA